MKRTCNGCCALTDVGADRYSCQLLKRVGIKRVTGSLGDYYEAVPKEECQKPKTIKQLLLLREEMFKRNAKGVIK